MLVRRALPLLLLALLQGCAPAATEVSEDDASAIETAPPPAEPKPAKEQAPVLASPGGTTPACAEGPALTGEALLARASQGDAPSVSFTGTLRIATRSCASDRCQDEVPRDLPVVVALARTVDGAAWRGQLSPTTDLVFALEVGSAGDVRGELVSFGPAEATASIAGRATTTCLDARATAKAEADGKRIETTVSLIADVLAALPAPPVSEEPPAPSCDSSATVTYPWQMVQNAGGRLASSRVSVMEQYRDCRFATGCAPWKSGPVGADGTSPWTRAPGAPVTPLEVWSTSTFGQYYTVQTEVFRSAAASARVTTLYPTLAWTSSVLGREASLDVKFTEGALVFTESGKATPEKADARVRSRRYACLAWAK